MFSQGLLTVISLYNFVDMHMLMWRCACRMTCEYKCWNSIVKVHSIQNVLTYFPHLYAPHLCTFKPIVKITQWVEDHFLCYELSMNMQPFIWFESWDPQLTQGSSGNVCTLALFNNLPIIWENKYSLATDQVHDKKWTALKYCTNNGFFFRDICNFLKKKI